MGEGEGHGIAGFHAAGSLGANRFHPISPFVNNVDGEMEEDGDEEGGGDGGEHQHGEVEEHEAEEDEQVEVQVAKDPHRPTPEEVRKHNILHLPYRSWCRHCVAGRGQAPPHRRARSDRQMAEVGVDYFFMGHKGTAVCMPCIAVKDYDSKAVYSHVVVKKGAHKTMVKRVVNDLYNMGHKRLVLKSDQEPSIKDLAKAVKQDFGGDIILEDSPVGESQSNGSIEAGIKSIEGMIRTIKSFTEEHYNKKIYKEHTIMPWIVEHAGYLLTYYGIGRDGKTPNQLLKGKHTHRPMYELGEKVRFHPLGLIKGRGKLDTKMLEGIWLGLSRKSGEYIIGTPEGIRKARTVFRVPEAERWDAMLLDTFKGLPWNLKPEDDEESGEMPEVIVIDEELAQEGVGVEEKGMAVVPRRARLDRSEVKKFIEKYGATAGCPGCDAIRMNLIAKAHTEHCRKRIEKYAEENEKLRERISAAADRQNTFIAGRIEEQDKEDKRRKQARQDYEEKESRKRKEREEEDGPGAPTSQARSSSTPIVIEPIPMAQDDPYTATASSSSTSPSPNAQLPQSDPGGNKRKAQDEVADIDPRVGDGDETMELIRTLDCFGVDTEALSDKVNELKQVSNNMRDLLNIDVSEIYSPPPSCSSCGKVRSYPRFQLGHHHTG